MKETLPKLGLVDTTVPFDSGYIRFPDCGSAVVATEPFHETEGLRPVCFMRGTMIATPAGEVAIEDLSEGDLITTRDSGDQNIRWVGSQLARSKGRRAPVRIAAGALGNDRDLRVSQLHRMLVTDWRAELMFEGPEILVAAKHLVNGDTITVEENPDELVEYFHILLDTHEIVTANGAPSESFHPGQQGMGWLAKEVREEIFDLMPDLRTKAQDYGDTARITLEDIEAQTRKS